MRRTQHCTITLLLLMALFVVCRTMQAQVVWNGYDPGLGTLPEMQGFSRTTNNGVPPEPALINGALHQGPTGAARQYWLRNTVPLDFNTGFTLEFQMKVLSSDYVERTTIPPTWRTGYEVDVYDRWGHYFSIGLAGNGIVVTNNESLTIASGIPFTPLNMGSDFLTYRFVTQAGMGHLYVDGTQIGSSPLGPTGGFSSNLVGFGDRTIVAGSETELRLFRFTTAAVFPVNPVPEPSALALLL